MFNTLVEREADLYMIKDLTFRKKVKEEIFDNPINDNYKRFGLRTIAIPDNMKQYPSWLVDIIDINKVIEKHMSPITSLLPSINIYTNRVKTTRRHLSPLINL